MLQSTVSGRICILRVKNLGGWGGGFVRGSSCAADDRVREESESRRARRSCSSSGWSYFLNFSSKTVLTPSSPSPNAQIAKGLWCAADLSLYSLSSSFRRATVMSGNTFSPLSPLIMTDYESEIFSLVLVWVLWEGDKGTNWTSFLVKLDQKSWLYIMYCIMQSNPKTGCLDPSIVLL